MDNLFHSKISTLAFLLRPIYVSIPKLFTNESLSGLLNGETNIRTSLATRTRLPLDVRKWLQMDKAIQIVI